ncbi:type III-B CRISPR module-associated protein Cmr5 [Deinococcus sp. YIM 77859]|uniref:type III-B CRISPR module-associated protein Cmr5 n=1 Tax=Deinococcus sp. YIM 77859 TaxID=1540221 RepID=UPI0006909870|nr:type III-B CRISPR module-associated protein Cmr5 [Deinococcus sp. YIM 77859]
MSLDPMSAAMNNMLQPQSGPVHKAPSRAKFNRVQRDIKQAVEQLEALAGASDGVKRNYLRRVKDFPALVMQVGLAQAVAFSVDKASKSDERGQAHRHLLNHLWAVWQPGAQGQPVSVETGAGREQVLIHLQGVSTAEYRHLTRRTLAAWVYVRRLSESILDPDGKLGEERE